MSRREILIVMEGACTLMYIVKEIDGEEARMLEYSEVEKQNLP